MHNIQAKTMKTGIYAAIFLILSCGGAANAAEPAQTQTPAPQGDLFSGTPEEQAACSPDATRFCSDAIPDTFRVLACLQDHREKLRKVCQKVLIDHGQ
jgi:hypothetical protein